MPELLILSRAVHLGACLLLLAAFAVRMLVESRATAGPRRMAGVCLATAAGSGFLWFWVSVAGMSGSGLWESLSPQLFQMVITQTPPGMVWAFRFAVGLVLAVMLFVPRQWRWGAVPAALLVGSLAWLGHAGAGEDGQRTWMLAADVTHLLAASFWPAGLLPFALLLRRVPEADAPTAARRFSAMSLIAVGVLAVTGTINACFLVGSFHALVASDYGRLLILKVALFLGAIALGACNLLIHKPRQEMEAMARKVWVEVALGTLIVLVVAIMGTLPPAAHP